MKKFEYLKETKSLDNRFIEIDYLNLMGQQGWEFIKSYGSFGYETYLFKRQIIES